jgi:hypothetical protein
MKTIKRTFVASLLVATCFAFKTSEIADKKAAAENCVGTETEVLNYLYGIGETTVYSTWLVDPYTCDRMADVASTTYNVKVFVTDGRASGHLNVPISE